jgi:hypothetical protein
MLPAAASWPTRWTCSLRRIRDLYARVIGAFADAEGVDAVIVIFTPTGLDDPVQCSKGIGRGSDELAGVCRCWRLR